MRGAGYTETGAMNAPVGASEEIELVATATEGGEEQV